MGKSELQCIISVTEYFRGLAQELLLPRKKSTWFGSCQLSMH